jgi:hypothetical protein
MYRVPPTWPAWPAVGAQLERGVRPHSATNELCIRRVQPTKPKPIKDPNQPDSSIPTLTDGRDPTVVVALTVSILIVLVVGTIVGFFKYTNKNKCCVIKVKQKKR